MFDWSDTVFRRKNVTRRRISNTVLQPRYWGKIVPMGAIVIRTRYDEGTESAEVATSETRLSNLPEIVSHLIYCIASIMELCRKTHLTNCWHVDSI
jgi:hypothetical protein